MCTEEKARSVPYLVASNIMSTMCHIVLHLQLLSRFIADLHEGDTAAVSGRRRRERHHKSVYMSGTAVCATVSAQMGVHFCQSSGTVSL